MKNYVKPFSRSRRSVFLLLLALSINFSLLAQESGYYLYVESLPESPKPESSGIDNSYSTSEQLNEMFSSFEVQRFHQSFPEAENAELRSYYEIHLAGNVDEFKESLTQEEFFGNIYKTDYPVLSGCTNPVGINDYWIVQNWANNYALDMIEAQCAWTITTGNNVEVAVVDTEIDTSHEDLTNQLNRTYGGPVTYAAYHGTITAGMVAAQTNNNKGVASIGYNTKIAFYRTGGGTLWNRIWKAYQDGSRIINVSWSGIGSYPNLLAVQEMIDNGTVVTLGAGNTPGANFHGAYAPIDGVINVSGVDGNNNHGPTNHARNGHIDLCAPSINVTSTFQGNTYGGGWGTSFAAPQVAGTAALMRSVNPCLAAWEIENMMKVTCDTIADDSAYTGLVGAGRLNAYKAVQLANQANSTTLDLYIKDRYDDFGVSGGYHWQAARDNSPDIWVRRQNDGLTNQVHEDPEYYINNPNYVYVKVRNKSCNTSSSQETLKLYWSKASSWSSWPQNWDGTSPTIGNLIDSIVVPPLDPGKDTILEFAWNILNPNIHNNWSTCLLARLENNPNDPITVYPGRIDDDVFFNNNIAMKNITVLDDVVGNTPPQIDEKLYPVGRFMYIGNVSADPKSFNFNMAKLDPSPYSESSASITEEAELKVITDEQGWNILIDVVEVTDGIEIFNEEEYTFIITDDEVFIENVGFPAETRVPIFVGYNFLTEEVGGDLSYAFKLEQYEYSSGEYMGGEHFSIGRIPRDLFYANAGENQEIRVGESATLEVENINEEAEYNWYDNNDTKVGSGMSIEVTPSTTSTYKVEVIALGDGFKDYDEVIVEVQHNWLGALSPNPTSEFITIDYTFGSGSSASLFFTNSSGTFEYATTIEQGANSAIIDVTGFPEGTCIVSFIVDGNVVDSDTFIKIN